MKKTISIPSELLQQSIISGLDIGVITCNEDDTIEWANPYLCQLLSVHFEDIKDTPIANLLDIDPLVSNDSSFRLKIKTKDNKELWLACVQNQCKDKENKSKLVRYFIDISDLQRRQLLRLAVSAGYENSRLDPHSGVLNRKTIIQELNTQVSRSRRYGNPLSAILLQHNMLSNLNTSEQKVSLQAVASCLNTNLRWVDMLGTLANGTFLIILPESDESAAKRTWEKINDAILELTQHRGQGEYNYRASYCTWQRDNNADEMIKRLEQSLGEKAA